MDLVYRADSKPDQQKWPIPIPSVPLTKDHKHKIYNNQKPGNCSFFHVCLHYHGANCFGILSLPSYRFQISKFEIWGSLGSFQMVHEVKPVFITMLSNNLPFSLSCSRDYTVQFFRGYMTWDHNKLSKKEYENPAVFN